MAVQEQTPLQEYTANGVTTLFALEFDCEQAEHLIVSIDDQEVLHTDWYLSGNAVAFYAAPANGKQIKIQRNTPFNRLSDYQTYNNSFRPPAINKEFDRIWWKLQELGVADWLLKLYVDQKDSELQENIDNLRNYVDDRDDELRAYLMEEIRKQGVALDQLDEYYNYLMQRLAQIAVDKGWDASFVVDGAQTQKEINLHGGKKYDMPPLGYPLGGVVLLDSGDKVISTIPNNTNDPNVDTTGWIPENSAERIIDSSGKTQQEVNDILFQRTAHVKDFGAVGDGTTHPLSERFSTLALAQTVYPFATSLSQEIDLCALKAMVVAYPSNAKLSLEGVNLYLGTLGVSQAAVLLTSPENLEISGTSAITAINSGSNCVVFGIKDPKRFKSHGIKFYDPTYDRATNIGGVRKGIIGFAFGAVTSSIDDQCGDIDIVGEAYQCLAHVVFDGASQTGVFPAANFYAFNDARITTKVTNSYYAVNNTYGCYNLHADIITKDVRRALIGYGQKHFKVRVSAENTAGFVGSNAFVELACEGSATTNPKTGASVNIEPEDFDIDVSVSGVEAHEGIVHFYHQNTITTQAVIRNGKANINLNNLTTVGKSLTIGNFNAFVFSYETSAGVQSTTDRTIDNVDMDVKKYGTISGSTFYVKSTPNIKTGRVSYGSNLCDSFPKVAASLSYFTNFNVLQGAIDIPQTIRLYGTTTAGTMTTTKSNAILSVDRDKAKYAIDVAWSAFDGSGDLRADGFSLARSVASSSISATGYDKGFAGVLSASLEGNRSVMYFYLKNSSGVSTTAQCIANGEIRLTLNFNYK